MKGWHVLAVGCLWLESACATSASWGVTARAQGTPARYAQSMNSAVDGCLRSPACVAASPGEEAVIPWAVRTVETVHAAATLEGLLDEVQVRRIEALLVQCAKEADFQVNEREYGPGKSPNDAECDRLVRDKNGREVKRAIELGNLKHEAAFACIRRNLPAELADNLSIEPRYGEDSPGRYVLTRIWEGSLRPDIVLHFAGNPNQVRCVYDLKFPCKASIKSSPYGDATRNQMKDYKNLGGVCPPAIVTPQLGVSRE